MKPYIATSGFQYPEWKGKFYPEKMAPAKMLAFYAAEFRSTEVNYTFRSMPSAKTIGRWRDETPEDFRFSLKAPQRVTHFAKLRGCGDTVNEFHDAVKGLGGKLGPVLFQLPETFKADAVLLGEFVRALPKGLRAAFEFRHESWFTDGVFDTLAEANAALCIAESEDLATPRIATADFGYLRPRRLDYREGDIRDQARFIREQDGKWSDAFVYYKHEETAAGPGFAKALKQSLE
ncbi:DUF72 domain-containing protein [Luteolibacter yonseiensis]|uniref:DUF72 domain-containing protein n=1 Tax=Luteolibacter yonseiensis TaxID=1144680 RepID=A0A934R008_9BACT|nr:DUF72 domain-containing protein [Luteolibacter yonseiensis]MBK1814197.1 DUF72 domain-containing protein [Luteolibacter yonseiensis]